jgi:HlyD family secretion protein
MSGTEISSKKHLEPRRSIRSHLGAGLAVVALLVGGVGGWAAMTEISGAVIAPGQLVVNSGLQDVQHPTGGVVAEIFARDGDRVEAGELLVRLDATVTRANLAVVTGSLAELSARKARLEAERDEAEAMTFDDDFVARFEGQAMIDIVTGEARLFEMRKLAREGQKEQLRERIAQYGQEISGLEAQAEAKTKEIELIERELEGTRSLYERGLTPIAKLTELERQATRLRGEQAQLTAAIAQTRGRISEIELQIIQIDRDLASEVASELRDVEARIAELVERRVSAEDQLKRIDIRAPQDGVVHQSRVHTVGGVVPAGEVLMQIVPGSEGLAVEARVRPESIDQLSIGQQASLRFTSFDQQTTPALEGTVTRVAADVSVDERTGAGYFGVRLGFEDEEVVKLGAVQLMPGMPVEVFIKTDDRNVLSYLVKPLRDQLFRAFRES